MSKVNLVAAAVVVALGLMSTSYAQVASRKGEQAAFVSGGVGQDEVEKLNAMSKDYNTRLVFTITEGNYVADVDLAIKDTAGRTVVEHVSGPIFLAQLPAGTYTVTATFAGKTQTRRMTVGGRPLTTAYMRWPANPDTDFPGPRD